MTLFKISFVTTSGHKLKFDTFEADYIKETSTGYALIDNSKGTIVYTVPAGLIAERINEVHTKCEE